MLLGLELLFGQIMPAFYCVGLWSTGLRTGCCLSCRRRGLTLPDRGLLKRLRRFYQSKLLLRRGRHLLTDGRAWTDGWLL